MPNKKLSEEYDNLKQNISLGNKVIKKRSKKKNSRSTSKTFKNSDFLKTTVSQKRRRGYISKKKGGMNGMNNMFKSGLKSLKNKAGKAMQGVKNMGEATLKAGQIATRTKDMGYLFGFMPNQTEVIGRSDTADRFGLGGTPGQFTKNMWRNLKANILALSAIDHATFLRMLMVNPEDVQDYVNVHQWLEKKSNCNVMGQDKVLLYQENLGLKKKKKLESLKGDLVTMMNSFDIPNQNAEETNEPSKRKALEGIGQILTEKNVEPEQPAQASEGP